MTERKLGWRPDPVTVVYQPAHMLVARLRANKIPASALKVLDRCSMLDYRAHRIFQRKVGACVLFTACSMVDVWRRARDEQEPELLSPRWPYWTARSSEFADGVRSSNEIRELVREAGDTGCFPDHAWKAIERVGFVPLSKLPYPGIFEGEEQSDADAEEIIHEQPSPSLLDESYERRGIETVHVVETGQQKLQRIASLLRYGFPVGFGMTVDLAFMSNAGELIKDTNPFTAQGGHAMQILSVHKPDSKPTTAKTLSELVEWDKRYAETDPALVTNEHVFIVNNWWEDHGSASGLLRFAGGLVGSSNVRSVTALNLVPTKVTPVAKGKP